MHVLVSEENLKNSWHVLIFDNSTTDYILSGPECNLQSPKRRCPLTEAFLWL